MVVTNVVVSSAYLPPQHTTTALYIARRFFYFHTLTMHNSAEDLSPSAEV